MKKNDFLLCECNQSVMCSSSCNLLLFGIVSSLVAFIFLSLSHGFNNIIV